MRIRRNVPGIAALSVGFWLAAGPAPAQGFQRLEQFLPELLQPAQMQMPQDDYRRRDDFRRGDDFRDRPPPPPGPPGGRRSDEMRERMFDLRRACEDGDRRACIRFGIIIGENRERRAQWRRENPDLFWWER
jgi:hypothetical protein